MDPRSAHLRLSDADREQALARLGEHYAVGRLDKDEYDERSDAIWSAKTRADLRPVFADLPAQPAQQQRPAVHQRRRRGPSRAVLIAGLVALAIVLQAPWLLFGLFFLLPHGACSRR